MATSEQVEHALAPGPAYLGTSSLPARAVQASTQARLRPLGRQAPVPGFVQNCAVSSLGKCAQGTTTFSGVFLIPQDGVMALWLPQHRTLPVATPATGGGR